VDQYIVGPQPISWRDQSPPGPYGCCAYVH